jgi:hypothetical protein
VLSAPSDAGAFAFEHDALLDDAVDLLGEKVGVDAARGKAAC